jgi:hypothetical protein
MIAYANINSIKFLDYFGGMVHNSVYTLKLVGFILVLIMITFLKRKVDLKNS